jgi:hypothetical protein
VNGRVAARKTSARDANFRAFGAGTRMDRIDVLASTLDPMAYVTEIFATRRVMTFRSESVIRRSVLTSRKIKPLCAYSPRNL